MNENGLKIIELRQQGFGCKQIEKLVGCSRSTVSKYINLANSGVTTEEFNKRLTFVRNNQSLATRKVGREASVSKGYRQRTSHNGEMRFLMKNLSAALLGNKCRICSYNKYMNAMCFHHFNPSDKLFDLKGNNFINRRYFIILEEIKKCVLLCHNCHMEVHAGVTECPPLTSFFFDTPADPKTFKIDLSNLIGVSYK